MFYYFLKAISIVMIVWGIILFLIKFITCRCNNNYPKEYRKSNLRFAVVIPARGESLVIGELLESIRKQSREILLSDVYVIVPDESDLSVDIVNDYGASILYRTNPTKARKGYALDEGIKQILKKNIRYDAYFIMDADNVLDVDYFKEMEKLIREGYDIGIGYRDCKNGNDNVIAACSSLTFSMINTMSNANKVKYSNNLIISGTGFYIRGEWIEKWNGYPFDSLTEDYELSLYAICNNMTTGYNDRACFYDEQPVRFKQTVYQRVRWIRGYFSSRKEYRREFKNKIKNKDCNFGSVLIEYIGVMPIIWEIIGFVLLLVSQICGYFILGEISLWKFLIFFLVFVYICLFLVTGVILYSEKDKLSIDRKMRIKALFFNPIYLITYVPCAIVALVKKDIDWVVIPHNKSIKKNNH